jgi:hypothetical protein
MEFPKAFLSRKVRDNLLDIGKIIEFSHAAKIEALYSAESKCFETFFVNGLQKGVSLKSKATA